MGKSTTEAVQTERTIGQQINDLEAEIGRRKQEITDLDTQARESALSDADRSIDFDLKARATERLVVRLEGRLAELRNESHAESIREREQRIDSAMRAEFASIETHMEQLKAKIPAITAAIADFLTVPSISEHRGDPPMNALAFLKAWAAEGLTENQGVLLADGIIEMMSGRLARGAAMLKRELHGATESVNQFTNADVAAGAGRINARLFASGGL
ncbi:MAG TPA: hypothetical protein VMW87_03540 [Spirochaetia bacterium]|nr:hypothetical protein [Spirochaetia bacterium]